MSKRILVATARPFDTKAINVMKDISKNEPGYELVLLEKYQSKNEFLEAVKNVDAIIVRNDIVDQDIISAALNLKIVVRAGAGYDNIDLKAATAKNVIAMNTPGQNSNAVAELAFGLMITIARKKYNGSVGTELRGKKIGIHAYGNVGKYVGLIAKGFGMEVLAYDPFVSKEIMVENGIKPCETIEELYNNCDYISLHIPATDKTKKSINYDLLKNTNKGTTLVNTARKEVIDEAGLLKLMEERADFLYVSDISPDAKDEFVSKFADRVIFTDKKAGAQTKEANNNAGIAAINQILDYFKTGNDKFRVN